MSTPSGKFYDLDLEVDLGREWHDDRGAALANSTLGRVSLVVVAASLGLLLGIAVGHLTAPRTESAPAASADRPNTLPAYLGAAPELTEAEVSVRRQLADLAFAEAQQRVDAGFLIGQNAAPGPATPISATPATATPPLDRPPAAPASAGIDVQGLQAAPTPVTETGRERAEPREREGRGEREGRRERSHRQRASGSSRWDDRRSEGGYGSAVRSILEIPQTDPYRR